MISGCQTHVGPLCDAVAMSDSLSDGLYESVVTASIKADIEYATDVFAELRDITPDVIDRALTAQIAQRMLIRLLKEDDSGAKVNHANQVLAAIDSTDLDLRSNGAFYRELDQIFALSAAASTAIAKTLAGRLGAAPLISHATYKREEILAALNWASLERAVQGAVTGVMWCEDYLADVFFVNLHKTKPHFSDTTMYKDYALGTELFHWESQGSTSPASEMGRRYIEHRSSGTDVLLFTRDAPTNDVGAGAPFRCLGQVDYVSHNGSKPIAFTWKLRREMPTEVYQSAAAVVV